MEGPANAGPSLCSGSWNLGEESLDPQAVNNTLACDEAATMTCLAANPRLSPFLPPSPANYSGGVVVIPRTGCFPEVAMSLPSKRPMTHLLSAPHMAPD